jgi:hypothetical protein
MSEILFVGAVYDRPHFVHLQEKRAVVDRPYKRK